MNGLAFEDLKVGQRVKSGPYHVTEEVILEFARQYDVQAFHLDRAAADASLFGGLAASGWHTAAIAMHLFTTGPTRFEDGAIGLAVDELRWPTAVRPGDAMRLETEILELRPSRSKPRFGVVRIRNILRNQKNETVLSYIASAMVRRRSGAGN